MDANRSKRGVRRVGPDFDVLSLGDTLVFEFRIMSEIHEQTELKSVEQFNKLLAALDKNAVITLQVKRGESTAFVTVAGLTDKG